MRRSGEDEVGLFRRAGGIVAAHGLPVASRNAEAHVIRTEWTTRPRAAQVYQYRWSVAIAHGEVTVALECRWSRLSEPSAVEETQWLQCDDARPMDLLSLGERMADEIAGL
jgi:hypothetical protein